MNISTFLGFAIAIWVLWSGVFASAPNPKLFLDPHAIILVCGGTLAASLIAFSFKKLFGLLDFVLLGALFKRQLKMRVLGEQIIFSYELLRNSQIDENYYTLKYHPFLIESINLLLHRNFEKHELEEILDSRIEAIRSEYQNDAKLLNALAKFPPAFGLLGASTGMISMMTKLGAGGAETIGPSMAIALVATFWGIAIANFVLLPLSDHAAKIVQEETKQRKMISDAILAMNKACSIVFLAEKSLSYIPLNDRKKFRIFVKDFLADKKKVLPLQKVA